MRMRKTIYSTMDVDVKYKNVWQLIRAWLTAIKFIIVRSRVGMTINGKNAGSINVVMFPKFRFSRAGE